MGNKDQYFVAVKVFLRNDSDEFLITKDRFGDWDIPGGRMREEDFEVPLSDVVARKAKEELGENVTYTLGEPVVFMRHERNELLATGEREKRRIFAIGYDCRYQAGEVKLGKNHEVFEWVSIERFNPEEYFTGGWLQGIKDFQKWFLLRS